MAVVSLVGSWIKATDRAIDRHFTITHLLCVTTTPSILLRYNAPGDHHRVAVGALQHFIFVLLRARGGHVNFGQQRIDTEAAFALYVRTMTTYVDIHTLSVCLLPEKNNSPMSIINCEPIRIRRRAVECRMFPPVDDWTDRSDMLAHETTTGLRFES